jgi:hypothetical protein
MRDWVRVGWACFTYSLKGALLKARILGFVLSHTGFGWAAEK